MISGVSMVTLGVNGGIPEFTVAATFFGVGAALVLDEFALIRDYEWMHYLSWKLIEGSEAEE